MARGAAHVFAGTERFEIHRQLGAGSMGVVYKAFDRQKDAVVALKTLSFCDAQSLYRFKREFRALQDVEHPNLVSLGELIEANGTWFFTMELLEGVDFITYIRGEPAAGAQSPDQTADPMAITDVGISMPEEARLRRGLRQLADGIAALHAAGMIHRDIKPSNIVASKSGRVVLLDFGLVRAADTEGMSTSDHETVGTASYMAPEQAVSGSVGPSADWYSVGVVLYEALTGRQPHVGSTALDVLMKKQRQPVIEPRHLVPDVPADLNALCVELLAILPQDRPHQTVILERLGVRSEPAAQVPRPSTSAQFTQSTPFVGRKTELAQLGEALAASRGRPVVTLIEGESGIGKSELVHHFARTVADDVVVLSGRCHEQETLPYKAVDGVADALSRHLMRLPEHSATTLMPDHVGYLSRLFPVLRRAQVVGEVEAESELPDAHVQRGLMFGAFRETLRRLAQRHPLVLVIDDLQWTDADSLSLLHEVLGHPDAPRLLLLASMRPLDSARRDAIRGAFELVSDLRELPLGRLPDEDARELAGLLFSGQSAPDLSNLIEQTDGHPLFIRELARHGLAKGNSSSLSLEMSLWRRIAALPVSERRLLQVVCAAGSPISQHIAQTATELTSEAFSKTRSLLRLNCLVRTDGSQPSDTISPYHNRVREVVTARQSVADKVHCHARLVAALERSGVQDYDPQRVLFHAEAAGQTARAAGYALAAAERAAVTMAFDRAADFYRSAFSLGCYEGQTRTDILRAWAGSLANAGRGPEAAARFMQAAESADAGVAIECRKRAAEQWIFTGHLEKGFAAGQLVLASVGESVAKTPARALASLMWHRFRVWSGGKGYVERPEREIDGKLLTRLDVLRSMGQGLSLVDNIRGADFGARFLLLARRTGEPVRLAQAFGSEASYLASQGGRGIRRGRRLQNHVAALAAARPENRYLAAYATLLDGNLSYFEGRFAVAASLLEEAGDAFAKGAGGATWERNSSRLFYLFALRHLGKLAQSRELSLAYLRDARRRGDRYLETTLRALHAEGVLAREGADAAEEELAMASWTPVDQGFHLQHWYELEARGAIALYRARASDAQIELSEYFTGLARSQLLRVQIVRVVSGWLRARLLLSSACTQSPSGSVLRAVARLERQLARENVAYASVLALLVRAGRLMLDPRSGCGPVQATLREAIAEADGQEMQLCAAAARRRLGELLEGDESVGLCADADRWFDGEGVANRAAFIEVILPGFPRG